MHSQLRQRSDMLISFLYRRRRSSARRSDVGAGGVGGGAMIKASARSTNRLLEHFARVRRQSYWVTNSHRKPLLIVYNQQPLQIKL